ncbi:SGNH/GDSL hydrolase family protein [Actinosynnema sp. NPDC050801]|uniref:SGNH/GDSL hydrolase family protein n=1 Tax=unclassified Actinosynnema TaxID=2637065 RepID=UPI0033F23B6B
MRISSRSRVLAVVMAVCAATATLVTPAHAAPAPARCAAEQAAGPGVAAAPFKVWLAGDSTMANGNSTCPVGWGREFDRLFNDDVTVVNNAVGGRSIQTWLYESNVKSTKDSTGECVVSPRTYASRWAGMLSSTNGMKAGDWLVIQFGINDGDRNCPRHVGTSRYRQLLATMAREAKARGVKPVYVTPVAAIRCSGSTAVGNRGFVNETIAQGQADQVPVIDLHQRSVNLYNSLRLCPNNGNYGEGAVGAFFCNDHTHFEAAGAARIAEVVARALREQGIGLAASLR